MKIHLDRSGVDDLALVCSEWSRGDSLAYRVRLVTCETCKAEHRNRLETLPGAHRRGLANPSADGGGKGQKGEGRVLVKSYAYVVNPVQHRH